MAVIEAVNKMLLSVVHISFVRCLMKTKSLFITLNVANVLKPLKIAAQKRPFCFFFNQINALLECLMKQPGALL